jgi:hypothetical protein
MDFLQSKALNDYAVRRNVDRFIEEPRVVIERSKPDQVYSKAKAELDRLEKQELRELEISSRTETAKLFKDPKLLKDVKNYRGNFPELQADSELIAEKSRSLYSKTVYEEKSMQIRNLEADLERLSRDGFGKRTDIYKNINNQRLNLLNQRVEASRANLENAFSEQAGELKALQSNYKQALLKAAEHKVFSGPLSRLQSEMSQKAADVRQRFKEQRRLLLEKKERALAGREEKLFDQHIARIVHNNLVRDKPKLERSVDTDVHAIEMEFDPFDSD